MDLDASKESLRQRIRLQWKSLTPGRRVAASAQTRAQLPEQPAWRSAQTVLFYAPLPAEIDIWPLLEETLAAGKMAALPRFDPRRQRYTACRVREVRGDLVIGRFGIREPSESCAELPPGDLDLVLVPGVAFDLEGRRLGRGRGFYDQLLQHVRGVKYGVAFEEQIVDEVPAGPRDVRMNFVLTPTECRACG